MPWKDRLEIFWGIKVTEFVAGLDMGGRKKEIGMIPSLLTSISGWMLISFTEILKAGVVLAENKKFNFADGKSGVSMRYQARRQEGS